MSKRLGKGLKALIPEYSSEEDRYFDDDIPIQNIIPNKNQPRQKFNQTSMEELINSIKENGILQPITLRELKNDSYELIAGERRLRAAKSAGLKSVPGYIIKIENETEMLEYALIENIQRDDLNPIEEAKGYFLLSKKYNLTQDQIAKRVGKKRTTITNSLRILKLPKEILGSLEEGDISAGHARAILKLQSLSNANNRMINLFKKILREKLNVREVEKIASNLVNNKNFISKTKNNNYLPILSNLENNLISIFGTKVQIRKNNKDKGKIAISFFSNDDLNRIIELISKIK